MEIHLAVNIGLLVIVAVGFIWSLLRELHIHAMQRSQEAAARQLAEHLGNVNRIIDSSNRLIEQALREISDGCDANKDANHQLVVFLRDIEQRLAAFAEGALMTLLPPAGWIIAGCIEVVRDARNRD